MNYTHADYMVSILGLCVGGGWVGGGLYLVLSLAERDILCAIFPQPPNIDHLWVGFAAISFAIAQKPSGRLCLEII